MLTVGRSGVSGRGGRGGGEGGEGEGWMMLAFSKSAEQRKIF